MEQEVAAHRADGYRLPRGARVLICLEGPGPDLARPSSRITSDASHDGRVRIVSVPARIAAIIRELEQAAVRGDVQAARELRAWLQEYPPEDESLDLSAIDLNIRKQLLDRLLTEIAEAEAVGG